MYIYIYAAPEFAIGFATGFQTLSVSRSFTRQGRRTLNVGYLGATVGHPGASSGGPGTPATTSGGDTSSCGVIQRGSQIFTQIFRRRGLPSEIFQGYRCGRPLAGPRPACSRGM
jgi:hypothetical protein